MPPSRPASPPQTPAPVTEEEARYIVEIVRRYYGANAVVRNWGPDPRRLNLHVEADEDIGLRRDECLGHLMCEINRDQISLDSTRRGDRIWGSAKLAYRQGVVLA